MFAHLNRFSDARDANSWEINKCGAKSSLILLPVVVVMMSMIIMKTMILITDLPKITYIARI